MKNVGLGQSHTAVGEAVGVGGTGNGSCGVAAWLNAGMVKDMTDRFVEYILTESRKKDDLISELTEQVCKLNERLASMFEMQSELLLMRKEIWEHLWRIRNLRNSWTMRRRLDSRTCEAAGIFIVKGQKE